jgi:hypothetical protein
MNIRHLAVEHWVDSVAAGVHMVMMFVQARNCSYSETVVALD